MPYYEIGVATVAAASGAAFATMHTGSSYRCQIIEIGLACNAATASSLGIIRPSNSPVATTSVLGVASNPADPASTVNFDTAWSTAPTVGTSFIRKITEPNTIGAGVIWTWPTDSPLVIATSSYLVFWNYGAGTASVLNMYVRWFE